MNTFIGLDIKKNTLRVASVTQKEDEITVNQFDEAIVEGNLYKPSSTNEKQLSLELSAFFKRNNMKQTNVIYSDFGFNLLIKTTTLVEEMDWQKLREAVFMEIGTSITVPFDEVSFDILSAKPTDKKEETVEDNTKEKKRFSKQKEKKEQEVNVVLANEKDLIYVGDAIAETKNIPYGVEMSVLSYQRLFAHFSMQKIKRNMYVLFELNCGEAVVTVMNKGIPIYTQYAEYNPDHWKIKLANGEKRSWLNQWNFDEVYEKNKLLSLIDTINRIINTFSNNTSGSGIKYLLLVGENPLVEEGISDFLSQHIDVPVVTPKLNIVDEKGKSLPTRYYKAVGLAMKKGEFK